MGKHPNEEVRHQTASGNILPPGTLYYLTHDDSFQQFRLAEHVANHSPVIEVTEGDLRIGCFRMTRSAFLRLSKEWDAFLARPKHKIQ